MPRLTRRQVQEINHVVDRYMDIVLRVTTGGGSPDRELMRRLGIPNGTDDLISDSYRYGAAVASSGRSLESTPAGQAASTIDSVQLGRAQRDSLDSMQLKADQYLDSLRQRIISNTVASIIQADSLDFDQARQLARDAVGSGVTRDQVVQGLRDSTGDYLRDWRRVAQTEMWGAKCQGEVDSIMEGHSAMSSAKGDTLVYVRPAPTACNKCRQLYLEPDGVTPRVFRMSDLLANGTNHGRRQADWVATIPPLHPNCMCVLNIKPENTEFDSSGRLEYHSSSNS